MEIEIDLGFTLFNFGPNHALMKAQHVTQTVSESKTTFQSSLNSALSLWQHFTDSKSTSFSSKASPEMGAKHPMLLKLV